MTTKTGANSVQTLIAIAKRQTFETYGSFSGYTYDVSLHGMPSTGILLGTHENILIDQAADVDYIVYSYSTPIAWHLTSTDLWVMPDVKYSATTSKHQHYVRCALIGYPVIKAPDRSRP